MSLEQTLTDEERLAELDLATLQQLVGLVEHDPEGDPFPVIGWDAVVWTVGNATQSAHFFQSALGMELVAYRGPETGSRDSVAYVLRSGAVRFVVTGGVHPDSPLIAHHAVHGDGVRDIALEVPDVDHAAPRVSPCRPGPRVRVPGGTRPRCRVSSAKRWSNSVPLGCGPRCSARTCRHPSASRRTPRPCPPT